MLSTFLTSLEHVCPIVANKNGIDNDDDDNDSWDDDDDDDVV